ncbi:MAG: virulence factor SrfB, partial [Planctomycetes bacterium]|nr:virulence factor SrfB [Planctomycetota bacterium]
MSSGKNDEKKDPPVIFTNTGVQILAFPIRSGRFKEGQLALGWQRCRCELQGQVKDYWYIQWQLIQNKPLLFLAIDTTLAPAEKPTDAGYFSKEGRMFGDFEVKLDGLLGKNDQILEGIGSPTFIIRSAQAEGGESKDVHLIVDFGNNRTGGLLVEFHGDLNQDPSMQPLQMIDRFALDNWDDEKKKGELKRDPSLWWFSSRAQWSTAPYLDPPRIEEDRYSKELVKKGMFGKEERDRKTTVVTTPDTFMDLSQIRLGKESGELSLIMQIDGKVSTALSSPKRYLWAKDASWLDGSIWHMADPAGRFDEKRHSATLRGPMLRYVSESGDEEPVEPIYDDFPHRPCYSPRTVMMGALYEILTQAYSYVNSPSYRLAAGYSNRARRLRSISMTFPSGMVREEREELKRQADRAAQLFYQTSGRAQGIAPEFHLSIDEASAAHLTYMWSEIQKLGKKPKLWFDLMARSQKSDDEIPAPSPGAASKQSDATDRANLSGYGASSTAEAKGRPRPQRSATGGARGASGAPSNVVKIACIDIGGGTSDLMIAEYECVTQAGGTQIHGKTLYRDGIYVAGDQLIKRVLERVVVPALQHAIGIEQVDLIRLFGPEVTGSNSEFRA